MVAPNVPPYRVVVLPVARAQITSIQAHAPTAESAGTIGRTLQSALRDLDANPTSFGDPIHSTKLAGGTVYQALRSPLVFRYAVFPERLVAFLYDVHLS